MAVATFYFLLIAIIALFLAGVCFAFECIERRQKIRYLAERNRQTALEIEQRRVATNQAKTMLECEKYNQASRK